MRVKILNYSFKPTDIAVASARSCYSSKGIITPDEVNGWSRKKDLLNSIFKAGHHTTLMHYHFTILIDGISRALIWRLLHSHPYYNSEQVSQRYAKMKIDNFTIPKNGDKKRWEDYYKKLYFYYDELIKKLTPRIEKILPKFKKKEAVKKAQEFARYLLPLGMNAYMYHTINVITALRYINAIKVIPEVKQEAKEFGRLLEEEMLKIDPDLKELIDFAKKEKVTFGNIDIEKIKKIKNIKKDVEVFDIIDYEFNLNENYAGVLRANNIYPDEAILGSFNSYIKLSLSADAQNQRHRRSFGIRPKLEDIYKKDYYMPKILENESLYKEAIDYSYHFFEEEIKNIGFSEAVYALLNAHKIEIIEHNDFLSFAHKAQMRLCFNAQEEIFHITYKQVKELREKSKSAKNFLPPCKVRYLNNIKPYCPEGERFCGVKVWRKDFDNFERII